MIINRYFDDEHFARLRTDFHFLVKIIKNYKGELELSLRDTYFNLYFRGNSAAKVEFKPTGQYEVSIHDKFYPENLDNDDRFSTPKVSGTYKYLEVSPQLLHPLFQRKYLGAMFSKIKKINYSEELILEQMIITDNLSNEKIIIIDRQVTDTVLKRRVDLLALRQQDDNRYQFMVLEVKMGNNPELKQKVADQVEDYVAHITAHFSDYKQCYETQYAQKKTFGLIEKPDWETIEIVPDVQGVVIVGGYSKLAEESIAELKAHHPALQVKQFTYDLDFLCD